MGFFFFNLNCGEGSITSQKCELFGPIKLENKGSVEKSENFQAQTMTMNRVYSYHARVRMKEGTRGPEPVSLNHAKIGKATYPPGQGKKTKQLQRRPRLS